MIRLFFKAVVLFVLSLNIFSIDVQLSESKIVEGETVTLSVNLESSLDREIAFPVVDGLNVSGSGSSTNVSIINSSITKTVTYTFTI